MSRTAQLEREMLSIFFPTGEPPHDYYVLEMDVHLPEIDYTGERIVSTCWCLNCVGAARYLQEVVDRYDTPLW